MAIDRDLTDFERAVLAHVVVDPTAWVSRPEVSESALAGKIAHHLAAFAAAVLAPDYQTRAERENAPQPVPSGSQLKEIIKKEAGRWILAQYPDWKQRNMTARMTELLKIRALAESWTAEEQAEVSALEAVWDWVKSVRSASDLLEAGVDGMTEEERSAFAAADPAHWPAPF